MAKRVDRKDHYKFKKGDRYHLDDIYSIQGIGGNGWWDYYDGEGGDDVVITRDAIVRAGYRLAMVQAMLQLPGETIADDARVAADLDLEDVRLVLDMALQVLA